MLYSYLGDRENAIHDQAEARSMYMYIYMHMHHSSSFCQSETFNSSMVAANLSCPDMI